MRRLLNSFCVKNNLVWSNLPALELLPRLFRLLEWGFLPFCIFTHTSQLTLSATNGITPTTMSNLRKMFSKMCRGVMLRGITHPYALVRLGLGIPETKSYQVNEHGHPSERICNTQSTVSIGYLHLWWSTKTFIYWYVILLDVWNLREGKY